MPPRIEVLDDASALADAAAREVVRAGRSALAERGEFRLVLAGGRTPEATYRRLSGEEIRGEPFWARTAVFWGDERCVPPDDPQSNYGRAAASILSRLSRPPAAVHRIRGERGAEPAAAEYDALLRESSGDPPRFDLVLLGMGADGHTASLFPGGSPADFPPDALAIPALAPAPPRERVTMTPRALGGGREILFLVQGRAKAEAVATVLGPGRHASAPVLPAGSIEARDGAVTWLLDREAASRLA